MAVSNTFLQGDALSVLRTLPSESVQMVCTSPPYFGLRAYLPDGHPDKPLEIGLESSPREYIEKLVEVFREIRRVLRSDGTCWVNLGDSYAAGKAGRTDYGTGDPTSTLGPQRNGLPGNTQPGPVIQRKAPDGFKPKDLMMIPARVAIALQDDGWYLRSSIIWHKPNAMPESVTDRPTSAYEHVFLLAKSATYYYDSESIKENVGLSTRRAASFRNGGVYTNNRSFFNSATNEKETHGDGESSLSGRNKRNVWTISSHPYSEAHFATMPPKLVEPCILAGSRPGDIVLDPFSGAGTVCLVAMQHGRKYIGIELNPEYITLAENRLDSARGLWETIA